MDSVAARRRRQSWIGLAILFALLLPVRVWRNADPGSLWIDEVFTILLANEPASRIVEVCATFDRSPPGYYLLLGAWLALWRTLGIEEGIFIARGLNLLVWVGVTASAWFGLRSLLGRHSGTIAAVLVAGSGATAMYTKETRGYLLGCWAILTAFMVLHHLARNDDDWNRRKGPRWWALYVVSATVALWMHFMSGLVVGLLGILWLRLSLRRPRLASPFLLQGAAAQFTALLLFVPWLGYVQGNVDLLKVDPVTWMTPATLWNFQAVFTLWYPLGGSLDHTWSRAGGLYVMGWLGLAAIAAAGLAAWHRSMRGRRGHSASKVSRPARDVLASAFLLSVVNVSLLWTLAATNLLEVFHGPRYTIFTAPLWLLWIGGVAGWSAPMLRWPRLASWGLVAPIAIAAVMAQGIAQYHDFWAGMGGDAVRLSAKFPPKGAVIHVVPERMIPYVRPLLPDHRLRPRAGLLAEGDAVTSATLLNANTWGVLQSPHDEVLLSLARQGFFDPAAEPVRQDVPPNAELILLPGFQPARLRALDLDSEAFWRKGIPQDAHLSVTPTDARGRDGWGSLEVGPVAPRPFLWSQGEIAKLRFRGPVPAGPAVLHVLGYRQPYPTPEVTFRLQVLGQQAIHEAVHGPWDVHLKVPIDFPQPTRDPVVLIAHPIWSPAQVGMGGDERKLGFVFYGAWIEAAAPPR